MCLLRLAPVLALSWGLVACGAVYPEVSTPVRPAEPGREYEPGPPPDLFYIEVREAEIPARTRDGRPWDEVGGPEPDPFLILFDGDREVFRTPAEPNSLRPAWRGQPRGNYRLPPRAVLRLELWDHNAITHRTICATRFRVDLSEGTDYRVDCQSGAVVRLTIEPARPRLGIGLYYELRAETVFVTRTLPESPAARAGLVRGDQIVRLMGDDVRRMSEGEVRTRMNANSRSGVELVVRKPSGEERTVVLKEGPIYPPYGEVAR